MSFEWNVEICAFLCIPDHIILITILIVICIVMGVEKKPTGASEPPVTPVTSSLMVIDINSYSGCVQSSGLCYSTTAERD